MKSRVWIIFLAVLLVALTLFVACAQPAPTPTATATPKPIATATPTPTATATPTPTATAVKATKLRFALMEPPSNFYAQILQKWADEFKQKTGGRYVVEFAWGGAMGPVLSQLDFVRTGVADMSFVLVPYTGGRLPLSSVFSLPIKASPDLPKTTAAYMELYNSGVLNSELGDVKLIAGWASLGQRMTLKKGPLTSLADIKGKKIRASGDSIIASIKALGAVPVSTMVLPEVYEALQKGTLDGASLEWDMMVDWKLNEQAKVAIEPGMFKIGQLVLMNKDTFNGMPKDVQTIVNDMIPQYSVIFGDALAARSKQGRDLFTSTGGTLLQWSDADLAGMDKMLAPVWQSWITEMEAKKLPAKEVLSKLYSILENEGLKKPFVGYTP